MQCHEGLTPPPSPSSLLAELFQQIKKSSQRCYFFFMASPLTPLPILMALPLRINFFAASLICCIHRGFTKVVRRLLIDWNINKVGQKGTKINPSPQFFFVRSSVSITFSFLSGAMGPSCIEHKNVYFLFLSPIQKFWLVLVILLSESLLKESISKGPNTIDLIKFRGKTKWYNHYIIYKMFS